MESPAHWPLLYFYMNLFFQWTNDYAISPNPMHDDVVLWLYKHLNDNSYSYAFDAMEPLPWRRLGDPYYTMMMTEKEDEEKEVTFSVKTAEGSPLIHFPMGDVIRSFESPLNVAHSGGEDYLTASHVMNNSIVYILNCYMEDPYVWHLVLRIMQLYFQWVNQAVIQSTTLRHDKHVLTQYKRLMQNIDAFDAKIPLPWKTVSDLHHYLNCEWKERAKGEALRLSFLLKFQLNDSNSRQAI